MEQNFFPKLLVVLFNVNVFQTEEILDWVQCRECYRLFKYKAGAGTTHILNHVCREKTAEKESNIFFK